MKLIKIFKVNRWHYLLRKIIQKLMQPKAPYGVLSIQVGESLKLPLSWLPGISWKVNGVGGILRDGKLCVDENRIGKESIISLTCSSVFMPEKLEYQATVVEWPVDYSRLEITKKLGALSIIGQFNNDLITTMNRKLYLGMGAKKLFLTDLPWAQKYRSDRSLLLDTEAGWFLRTDGGVVKSKDLIDWEVSVEIGKRGMFQQLDYLKCGDTLFVFTGEYSTEGVDTHSVYRGEYLSGESVGEWEKKYTFGSSKQRKEGLGWERYARHIHVVCTDKKTDQLWVATGDNNEETAILVSNDYGETFHEFAIGEQKYRTLMILFTENYVYWNMDTHLQDQCVFRVKKKDIDDILSGSVAVEDCEEVVAKLPYGAQWYGITVMSDSYKEGILMSASPESQVPGTKEKPHRDWNARLFLIEELEGERPITTEVGLFPPDKNISGKTRRYNRVDPRIQGEDGSIYFMSHNSVIKGSLVGRIK